MTTNDPIAKCSCGRLFSPMEWAELVAWQAQLNVRVCPCGLQAVRIQPITFGDVRDAYEKALKDDTR